MWPFDLVVAPCVIWGAVALWYHAPGGRVSKWLSAFLWSGCGLALLLALGRGWIAALPVFAAAFGGLLLWWRRIAPSNDRIWADDVAQLTTGTIDGSTITLENVRNFTWRSNSDYTPRWERRRYDLDRLNSVDLIMSYWIGPAIAHMLISFGFDTGAHIAFSVEIRRRRHGRFSEIGGLFKEYELIIIAADERDVIRVRTNVRREDTYLYRVRMPLPAMRSLLVAYVQEANDLAQKPRFYNTITVNCTTLVYHMMQRIVGHLPLDYRLILSGYLPGYVYRVGGLDQRHSLRELRALAPISERARKADASESFSADIRSGIPAIGAGDLPAP
jgi:Domain of unknown function (DUF4105)